MMEYTSDIIVTFRKAPLMKSYIRIISITNFSSSPIKIPDKFTNVANCLLRQDSKTNFLNGWDATSRLPRSSVHILNKFRH